MLKKVLQKETKNSKNFCLSQMPGEVTCNKCKTKLELVWKADELSENVEVLLKQKKEID